MKPQSCTAPGFEGPCGKPGDFIAVPIGKFFERSGVLCEEHQMTLSKELAAAGLLCLSALRSSHRRAAYLGESGRAFSAADVRGWMVEQGRWPLTRRVGRISQELINEYAVTH